MIHPVLDELVASVREPGGMAQISPERLAERLGLDARQLAGDDPAHVQETLRGVLQVLAEAVEIQPDLQLAIHNIRDVPIPAMGSRTLLGLALSGRPDAAVTCLQSLAGGATG